MSLRKAVAAGILVVFTITTTVPAYAQSVFNLPAAGVRVSLSPEFVPPILKGIKVYTDNPFRFDFILDKGESNKSDEELKTESTRLIKYFLASLTTPEKDLWVNLSPYEKDRIVPESFGVTEMGRDLLAEDYLLKQITASVIYPEEEVGKKFWDKVYKEAQAKLGTTDVPIDTFNKVWIVPEKAVVYENAVSGTAYVVESKLKVMLEQDYLSLQKHEGQADVSKVGSDIVREIIIPILEKEVNEGKNFAQLRQVYSSLILATWYKKKIKDSILNKVYINQNKVAGVNIDDPQEKQQIYERYLQAFKKGVYNYIKEDYDAVAKETILRKYFAGGLDMAMLADGNTNLKVDILQTISDQSKLPQKGNNALVLQINVLPHDRAMMSGAEVVAVLNSNATAEKKGKALADLIQDNLQVRRSLIKSRSKLVDLDTNPQYFILVNGRPVFNISFLLQEMTFFETKGETRIYHFYSFKEPKNGKIAFKDFLALKVSADGAEEITVEDLLKQKGFFKFMENGLPMERKGSLIFDNSTQRIRVDDQTESAVYTRVEINYDENRGLLSTGIGTGSLFDEPLSDKESHVLGFHFHLGDDEDITPSFTDMGVMIRNNRPELIMNSSGRGAIWVIKDLERAQKLIGSPHYERLKEQGSSDAFRQKLIEPLFESTLVDLKDEAMLSSPASARDRESNKRIQTNNNVDYWMTYFAPFFSKDYKDIEEVEQDFGPRLWYMMRGDPEKVRQFNSKFDFPASHPDDPEMFIEFGKRFREEWNKHGFNDKFGSANQYLARVTRQYWPADLFDKDLEKQANIIKTSQAEVLEELIGHWQGVFTIMHLRLFGPHADKVNGKDELLDNNAIVRSTKEYIQMLLIWDKQDEWNLKTPVQKGYKGLINFTYRDLMLWGLVVMLDPLIHDYMLEPTRNESTSSVDETRLAGLAHWPEGPQAAIADSMKKTLSDLEVSDGKGGKRKVNNKELENLLIEAFSINWKARGLRSPFEVFSYTLDFPYDHPDVFGGEIAPPQTAPFLVDRMFTVVAPETLHSSPLIRKQYFRDRKNFKYAAGLASYMLLTEIPFVKESFPRLVSAVEKLDPSGQERETAQQIVVQSKQILSDFLKKSERPKQNDVTIKIFPSLGGSGETVRRTYSTLRNFLDDYDFVDVSRRITNYGMINKRIGLFVNGERWREKDFDTQLPSKAKIEIMSIIPDENDAAMLTTQNLDTKGGIDFNPDNINLQIQNQGEGIKFNIDPVMLQQLQDAPGFVPVILNVQPMADLHLFLGLTDNQNISQTDRL